METLNRLNISIDDPLIRLHLQKDKIVEKDGKYITVKLKD